MKSYFLLSLPPSADPAEAHDIAETLFGRKGLKLLICTHYRAFLGLFTNINVAVSVLLALCAVGTLNRQWTVRTFRDIGLQLFSRSPEVAVSTPASSGPTVNAPAPAPAPVPAPVPASAPAPTGPRRSLRHRNAEKHDEPVRSTDNDAVGLSQSISSADVSQPLASLKRKASGSEGDRPSKTQKIQSGKAVGRAGTIARRNIGKSVSSKVVEQKVSRRNAGGQASSASAASTKSNGSSAELLRRLFKSPAKASSARAEHGGDDDDDEEAVSEDEDGYECTVGGHASTEVVTRGQVTTVTSAITYIVETNIPTPELARIPKGLRRRPRHVRVPVRANFEDGADFFSRVSSDHDDFSKAIMATQRD